MISERFGRGSRTVDLELEAQIEVLRDTKRKYENVLRLARALTNHFYNMVQTQHALGDTFADLSQKSPELRVRSQNLFLLTISTRWSIVFKACDTVRFVFDCWGTFWRFELVADLN